MTGEDIGFAMASDDNALRFVVLRQIHRIDKLTGCCECYDNVQKQHLDVHFLENLTFHRCLLAQLN